MIKESTHPFKQTRLRVCQLTLKEVKSDQWVDQITLYENFKHHRMPANHGFRKRLGKSKQLPKTIVTNNGLFNATPSIEIDIEGDQSLLPDINAFDWKIMKWFAAE